MKPIYTLLHPLRVRVTETLGTDRRTYRHRARDLTDALEWAACYPRGTSVVISSRFGRIIARRDA
jgi:hypothetical protein